MDHSSNSLDDSNILRKRLLGAAVLIALAVIFLPLLLDGSGTESRFRRVEQLRVEPPRILNEAGQPEAPAAAKPAIVTPEPAKPVELKPEPKPEPKPAPQSAPQSKPEPVEPKPTVVPKAEPVVETPPKPTIALPTQPTTTDTVAGKPESVNNNPATSSPSNTAQASAWVIQAGSFSEEANALSMRDQVRAAGYPAFVSSKGESADGKTLYRVKVGPITERDKAAAVQSDLQSLLGQKTLIRQYP